MKNRAINALIEIGMPANIKGFDFIVEAMEMFADEEVRNGKVTELYRLIAKKFNTTPSGVERAIRHAFSIITASGNSKAVEKYLTLQHMTSGNLLKVFYLRLTQEI